MNYYCGIESPIERNFNNRANKTNNNKNIKLSTQKLLSIFYYTFIYRNKITRKRQRRIYSFICYLYI